MSDVGHLALNTIMWRLYIYIAPPLDQSLSSVRLSESLDSGSSILWSAWKNIDDLRQVCVQVWDEYALKVAYDEALRNIVRKRILIKYLMHTRTLAKRQP